MGSDEKTLLPVHFAELTGLFALGRGGGVAVMPRGRGDSSYGGIFRSHTTKKWLTVHTWMGRRNNIKQNGDQITQKHLHLAVQPCHPPLSEGNASRGRQTCGVQ